MKNFKTLLNGGTGTIGKFYECVPREFGCAECKIVLHRLVLVNAGLKCPIVLTMQGACLNQR
jgi:hypothetical protein